VPSISFYFKRIKVGRHTCKSYFGRRVCGATIKEIGKILTCFGVEKDAAFNEKEMQIIMNCFCPTSEASE